MLIVKDEEHLKKVKEFAAKRGLLEKLEEELARLDNWFGAKLKTTLFPDFAPHSFFFILEDAKGVVMNGGLIYFGPGDTGIGGPQYSVRLGETTEGWSVHT